MLLSAESNKMQQNSQQIAATTTVYDLNALLNAYDPYSVTSTSSYTADNFDLSLLTNGDITIDPNNNFTKQEFIEEASNLGALTTKSILGPLSIETENSNKQFQGQQIYMKKEDNFYWQPEQSPPQTQQLLSPYHFQNSSLLSPQSPDTNSTSHISTKICPPSPCPSLEYSIVKQEYQVQPQYQFLPLSPPDSNGVPSPGSSYHSDHVESDSFDDFYIGQKSKLNSTAESTIDINFLTQSNNEDNQSGLDYQNKQDHQVLREFLQDTTFQRKHNLKPLALESLLGWTENRTDIEPVISLALEHAKREVQQTCKLLNISPDPQQWTQQQVQLWLATTIKQFKLDVIENQEQLFPENGQQLLMLSEEDLMSRAPMAGSLLYAQLEIWKAAYVETSNMDTNDLMLPAPIPTTTMLVSSPPANDLTASTSTWNQVSNDDSDMSDDEDSEMALDIDLSVNQISSPNPTESTNETTTSESQKSGIEKQPTKKHASHLKKNSSQPSSSHIHLWQFLKELLASPQIHGTAIRWLDRNKGIFKIEDSVRVARLWGRRKNRPAMNYDKLSRSIRQYYKKGIMKKTERSQRLVYQFCHPYCL